MKHDIKEYISSRSALERSQATRRGRNTERLETSTRTVRTLLAPLVVAAGIRALLLLGLLLLLVVALLRLLAPAALLLLLGLLLRLLRLLLLLLLLGLLIPATLLLVSPAAYTRAQTTRT